MRSFIFSHALFVWLVLSFGQLLSTVPAYSEDLFFGVALEGHIDRSSLAAVSKELKLKPTMVVFYLTWPKLGQAGISPLTSIEAISNSGAIPCLTWEPMYIEGGREVTVAYQDILAGKYDAYIDSVAQVLGSFKKTVLVRLAHEMNINRYHWGTSKEEYGPKSPETYRSMFRYVVSRFRKLKVTNVKWVFSPNAESVPNTGYEPSATWNEVENYYPGDEYVDVLGMDGYNWGTTQSIEKNGWNSSWKSFEQIFTPLFTKLKQISESKPIIVLETASVTQGGKRSDWLREAKSTLPKWKIPGLVWFQVSKEQDWKLNHAEVNAVFDSESKGQAWLNSLTKQ